MSKNYPDDLYDRLCAVLAGKVDENEIDRLVPELCEVALWYHNRGLDKVGKLIVDEIENSKIVAR